MNITNENAKLIVLHNYAYATIPIKGTPIKRDYLKRNIFGLYINRKQDLGPTSPKIFQELLKKPKQKTKKNFRDFKELQGTQ